MKLTSFILLLLFSCATAAGQSIRVKGRVLDKSQRLALEGVSVITTSGRGTTTDSLGNYTIFVSETDSLYFSYQNKLTGKFPVLSIADFTQFNMSLHVTANELPPVTIFGRNYKLDSLRNRQEYAKYFSWERPNPLRSINMANGGVGMDPNAIINLFRFRRNRQLESLRNRLVDDEQVKYVDFRFNAAFVRKLTGLTDATLQAFMKKHRPPYDFVAIVNDLELGYYIQQCYRRDLGLLPANIPIYSLPGAQELD